MGSHPLMGDPRRHPRGHLLSFPPRLALRWGAGLVPAVLCLQRELRKRTKLFLRIENNELKLYIKSCKDCIERERAWGRWYGVHPPPSPPPKGTLLAVAGQSENKAMKCTGRRGTSCDPTGPWWDEDRNRDGNGSRTQGGALGSPV